MFLESFVILIFIFFQMSKLIFFLSRSCLLTLKPSDCTVSKFAKTVLQAVRRLRATLKYTQK
jgi:hypothetical protein